MFCILMNPTVFWDPPRIHLDTFRIHSKYTKYTHTSVFQGTRLDTSRIHQNTERSFVSHTHSGIQLGYNGIQHTHSYPKRLGYVRIRLGYNIAHVSSSYSTSPALPCASIYLPPSASAGRERRRDPEAAEAEYVKSSVYSVVFRCILYVSWVASRT